MVFVPFWHRAPNKIRRRIQNWIGASKFKKKKKKINELDFIYFRKVQNEMPTAEEGLSA